MNLAISLTVAPGTQSDLCAVAYLAYVGFIDPWVAGRWMGALVSRCYHQREGTLTDG